MKFRDERDMAIIADFICELIGRVQNGINSKEAYIEILRGQASQAIEDRDSALDELAHVRAERDLLMGEVESLKNSRAKVEAVE